MNCVGGYTGHSLVFSFVKVRKPCRRYDRFKSTELHLHGVTGMYRDSAGMVLSFNAFGVHRNYNDDFCPIRTYRSIIDIMRFLLNLQAN